MPLGRHGSIVSDFLVSNVSFAEAAFSSKRFAIEKSDKEKVASRETLLATDASFDRADAQSREPATHIDSQVSSTAVTCCVVPLRPRSSTETHNFQSLAFPKGAATRSFHSVTASKPFGGENVKYINNMHEISISCLWWYQTLLRSSLNCSHSIVFTQLDKNMGSTPGETWRCAWGVVVGRLGTADQRLRLVYLSFRSKHDHDPRQSRLHHGELPRQREHCRRADYQHLLQGATCPVTEEGRSQDA